MGGDLPISVVDIAVFFVIPCASKEADVKVRACAEHLSVTCKHDHLDTLVIVDQSVYMFQGLLHLTCEGIILARPA